MNNDDTTLVNLIKENKKLICSIIKKYITYYDFDDLYQVSIIGIIKAWNNYKIEKNVKFTTYAYKYILSEVISFINNSKLIKTSKEYHKIYKRILQTRNILTQKLMKEPSTHEISVFLEIDECIINDIIRYQDNIKSLDEIISNDTENLTLLDKVTIEKNNINIDSLSLKEELKKLKEEELELIHMRYYEDKTQSEIASYFGTNQVKISRNEQKILKKLKNNLCKT